MKIGLGRGVKGGVGDIWGSRIETAWPSSGGSEGQDEQLSGVEAPWPLALVQKSNRQKYQEAEYSSIFSSTQGGQGRYTGNTEGPATVEPSRG